MNTILFPSRDNYSQRWMTFHDKKATMIVGVPGVAVGITINVIINAKGRVKAVIHGWVNPEEDYYTGV